MLTKWVQVRFWLGAILLLALHARTLESQTNPLVSVREIRLATNDVVYDSSREVLYASVPSRAGETGNTIVSINPITGEIGQSVFVGSEPNKLALSKNCEFLYVGLDGSGTVCRLNLAENRIDSRFGPSDNTALFVGDMEVDPTNPLVVAISSKGEGRRFSGLAVFDNGIMRPKVDGLPYAITYSASGSRLYAYNNLSTGFEIYRVDVDQTGISVVDATPGLVAGFYDDIKFSGGLIYHPRRRVVDPEAKSIVGSFAFEPPGPFGPQAWLVQPDANQGRVFFLTGVPATPSHQGGVPTLRLRAFNQQTFAPIGELDIPGIVGNPSSLSRWGANGLVFRTSGDQLFLVQTSLVSPSGTIPPPVVPPPNPPPPAEVHSLIRELQMPVSDLVYDRTRKVFYASIPGFVGPSGNSIASINPFTGEISSLGYVGNEPGKLAISDDGKYLYVALFGAFRRIDLSSKKADLYFDQAPWSTLPWATVDMKVAPRRPSVIAVSGSDGFVRLYENGVLRRTVQVPVDSIEFGASSNSLYAYGGYVSSVFSTVTLNDSGPVQVRSAPNLIYPAVSDHHYIRYSAGLVYASTGRVIDPEEQKLVGTFSFAVPNGSSNLGRADLVLPHAEDGRVYFLVETVLQAFDAETFRPLGSQQISGIRGKPTGLLRWGTNGLAFTTDAGQILFVQSELIPSSESLTPLPIPQLPRDTWPEPTASITRIQNFYGPGSSRPDPPIRDIVYSSKEGRIYASIGISIAAIDPATGRLTWVADMGTTAGKLALSRDGRYLYIALDIDQSIARYNTLTKTIDLKFSLGNGYRSGGYQYPVTVEDMEVLPDSPGTLIASLMLQGGVSPRHAGVVVFHDGVARPDLYTTGLRPEVNRLEPGVSSTVYGFDNEDTACWFTTMHVDARGLIDRRYGSGEGLVGNGPCFGLDIGHYQEGRIYSPTGRVMDMERAVADRFFGGNHWLVVPEVSLNRVFYIDFAAPNYYLSAYDLRRHVLLGAVKIYDAFENGPPDDPIKFVTAGPNGFGVLTRRGKLILIDTDLVPSEREFQIAPTWGPTSGNTRVRIPVDTLRPGFQVTVCGAPLREMEVVSDWEVVGKVASHSVGTCDIKVSYPYLYNSTDIVLGTYSFRELPAFKPTLEGPSTTTWRIPYVVDDRQARVNLGINNTSAQTANVKISFVDASGLLLGETLTEVAPHGMEQINNVARFFEGSPTASGREGYLVLESNTDIRAWASHIDNQSSDPSLELARSESASRVLLPSSVSNELFSTSLTVINTSGSAGSVTIRIRDSEGQVQSTIVGQAVPAFGYLFYSDLYRKANLGSGFGPVEIEGSNGIQILAVARIATPQSTSGYFEAVDVANAAITAILPFVTDTRDFRTNLGINNLGTTTADVNLTLYGKDGVPLGELRTAVPAGGSVQLNGVVQKLLRSTQTTNQEGYLRLVSNQKIIGWSSQIDNMTQDPSLVVSKPAGESLILIPSVSRVGDFRSTLAVVNLDSSPAVVEFRFRDTGGQLTSMVREEIAAQGMFSTNDIVEKLGMLGGYGPLEVYSPEGKPLLAVSRVFSSKRTGGYFEGVPFR